MKIEYTQCDACRSQVSTMALNSEWGELRTGSHIFDLCPSCVRLTVQKAASAK